MRGIILEASWFVHGHPLALGTVLHILLSVSLWPRVSLEALPIEGVWLIWMKIDDVSSDPIARQKVQNATCSRVSRTFPNLETQHARIHGDTSSPPGCLLAAARGRQVVVFSMTVSRCWCSEVAWPVSRRFRRRRTWALS